jgi:hypothetical protein
MVSDNELDRGRFSNLNPQPGPPFFKLSAELRNGIYGLVLHTKSRLLIPQHTGTNSKPALPQVNKQILAEAGSLYYGSNVFEVNLKADSLHVLADWAAPLTRTDFAYVRRLELNFVLEERHFEQGLDKGYAIIAIEADPRDLVVEQAELLTFGSSSVVV